LSAESPPTRSPLVTAYFNALEWAPAATDSQRRPDPEATAEDMTADEPTPATADLVNVLLDAGVIQQPPRALLAGPAAAASRLTRIEALLAHARESTGGALETKMQEVAYLANAIATGCTIQSRPFAPQEAYDAAVATCNLGLERWPSRWSIAPRQRSGDASPAEPDLIAAFQVGWTVLYDDVCVHAADRLVAVVSRLRLRDFYIQRGLIDLRSALLRHLRMGAPWRASEAFDVLTSLDLPSWAALLALIAECPVLHAGIAAPKRDTRTVSGVAFEFVSELQQLTAVRDFLDSLPERLRG
jgi:hypothetical protein